ncbi:hypothetical protein [Zhongshania aliphaticivorans]|uniref:hypothetical protein n=1 Tax=Zhongshania aliphaticivorans TaxID=1470434 RepID=UPI0012E5BAE7|nr:hypothetical protein [Zhongshania aliphaticivorans]CAA0105724.1 Uncharacterised protein [Zhongshania aliphaticivorans]
MKTTIVMLAIVLLFGTVGVFAKPPNGELPRGLQKKVAEGQQLPPGWQKKLMVGHRLEPNIYAHGRVIVPVDDRGHIIVMVEDRRLRLIQATLEIIEILN